MTSNLRGVDDALADFRLKALDALKAAERDAPVEITTLSNLQRFALMSEAIYAVCSRLRDALPAAGYETGLEKTIQKASAPGASTAERQAMAQALEDPAPTALMAQAFAAWAANKKGLAEDLHLLAVLREARLNGSPCPAATTLGGGGGFPRSDADESLPVHLLSDIRWHFDPASTGYRRRAFVDVPGGHAPSRRFVLGAYENGSWWVEEKLETITSGGQFATPTPENAKCWPLVGPLVHAKVAALVAFANLVSRYP